MLSVELLEAYFGVEDGSLHDCLNLVLARLWHLVRAGSFALYLLALNFLGHLNCPLRLVLLLDHGVRL